MASARHTVAMAMNRRSFISGLLASTVAAPVVKAIEPELAYPWQRQAASVYFTEMAEKLINPPIYVSPSMMAKLFDFDAALASLCRVTPMLPLDEGEVEAAIKLLDEADVPTEGRVIMSEWSDEEDG
jgi:hypothetical protein